MNRERRRQVAIARDTIRRAKDMLDSACSLLDRMADAEQDALDNIPESFQETDRYYDSEKAAETLEDSVSYLSDIITDLGEIL